jgi:hypothetical protein
MEYSNFLENKFARHKETGFLVGLDDINHLLFDWQKELVRLSLYRGKSAIFAGCGLGKTAMQIEWADHVFRKTGAPVLILAPLAVSLQTIREGKKFKKKVNICKDYRDVLSGVNVTNYEKLDRFDSSVFSGVVLDESSILKSLNGKTRNKIIDLFINTPYKLCCTATPSPNDYTELGNTSEFLGIMSMSEMLSMFFINDSGDTTANWRLKGHVKNNLFWEWVSSWSVMLQSPDDIGFDGGQFILPPLEIIDIVVPYTGVKNTLFVETAKTLSERRQARKDSLKDRVFVAADMINSSEEIWIAWCNLNVESEALRNSINNAVEIKGSDTNAHKEKTMLDFVDGKIKCLVTKPQMFGFGMNFQVCHNMVFVGLSDSFEQYYQAVRRCWRFGQHKTVNAYIVTGEREGSVADNIKRKESDMSNMFDGMIGHMKSIMKKDLSHTRRRSTPYNPKTKLSLPSFLESAI